MNQGGQIQRFGQVGHLGHLGHLQPDTSVRWPRWPTKKIYKSLFSFEGVQGGQNSLSGHLPWMRGLLGHLQSDTAALKTPSRNIAMLEGAAQLARVMEAASRSGKRGAS
jgi:hypothetical protein